MLGEPVHVVESQGRPPRSRAHGELKVLTVVEGEKLKEIAKAVVLEEEELPSVAAPCWGEADESQASFRPQVS